MAMPSTERNPARDLVLFFCPNCDAFAAHDWSDLLYQDEIDFQQGGFSRLENRVPDDASASEQIHDSWIAKAIWAQSTCVACEQPTVWREKVIIYPKSITAAPRAHADMPPGARKLYEEARLVVAVSRRAGAAMARSTLELLLKEVDTDAPSSLKLDGRIQRVIVHVSDSLGSLLDVIRHIGNKALHVEDEPDSAVVLVLDEENAEIVDVLFSAINDLVDELITKPARAQALSSQLPQSVRDGILQRATLSAQRSKTAS